jgi:hypothetical protein
MSGAEAVIPIIETVITWVGGALIVDTATGSHIQQKLFPPAEIPELPDYSVGGPSWAKEQARNQAIGLTNYLKTLTDIAPYYVSRHRPRLTAGYKAAIMKREADVRKAAKKLA